MIAFNRIVLLQRAVGISLALGCCAASASANLLSDSSFETPSISPAAIANFNTGDAIGSWTVISQSGNNTSIVQVLTNAYNEPGNGEGGTTIHFDAQDGTQALDLTGPSNQGKNGVEQTVTLTPGVPYALTFYVGNNDNNTSNYSGPSTVQVQINGAGASDFTNNSSIVNDVDWQQSSYTFTATNATTTIAFLNDQSGDNYTGLDNVDLEVAPTPAAACQLVPLVLGFAVLRMRRSGQRAYAS